MTNRKIIFIVGFLIVIALILIGAIIFLLNSKRGENVNSFQDCVDAGFLVMESYPRQCNTNDGKHFVEELNEDLLPGAENRGICVDKCGDGICQQIVCFGTNCPCAETLESCPQDCVE